MTARPRILVAVPLPEAQLARMRGLGEPVVAPSGFFPTREDLVALLPTVTAVATTVMCRFDAGLLARCPDLRVISACGVGLDHIDLPAASAQGIAVCNTPGLQNETVAEMAVALIFALARHTVRNDGFVRSGDWVKGPGPLGVDIRGKRLGLLGLGGIGMATARLGRALGMSVVYHKPRRDPDVEASGGAVHVERDELFRTADFLSLHLPLTEETRGSVGAREFGLMKPGSFLVNTARGAIVDEDALVDALRDGPLAAAGLDVMEHEPLPATSRLCFLPNVVLQPHAGGATRETRQRMEAMCVDNLLEAIAGHLPEATANRHALRPLAQGTLS